MNAIGRSGLSFAIMPSPASNPRSSGPKRTGTGVPAVGGFFFRAALAMTAL